MTNFVGASESSNGSHYLYIFKYLVSWCDINTRRLIHLFNNTCYDINGKKEKFLCFVLIEVNHYGVLCLELYTQIVCVQVRCFIITLHQLQLERVINPGQTFFLLFILIQCWELIFCIHEIENKIQKIKLIKTAKDDGKLIES